MAYTDRQATEERIEEKVENMDSSKKEQILADFNTFKQYLSEKVATGKKVGLGEEQLAIAAEKVGDYLAKHEDPRNSEEKLLQELWKVGTKEERHKLAHMLVKLVD
ncbi:DUF3243 domain-containing protein [Sutcliffiella rhizosphaerae]|uniref:DUF3243 domain-containing protein n=1 Tax=Sutcliffiella rhizosphaerae TaxID=2880967 RepID=A0ABN8AE24_9BACI|nr:DUF3243 domain-containing protein [Sutcliffiella rhizosphaerae]CAG9623520.1 putative protein YflH [Sutcliffiella rhizosphaerae]